MMNLEIYQQLTEGYETKLYTQVNAMAAVPVVHIVGHALGLRPQQQPYNEPTNIQLSRTFTLHYTWEFEA